MADPIELQIVEELRTRLREIRVANGYYTDAGERVHLGRVIDEATDALPALVVWIYEAVPVTGSTRGGHLRRTLPIVVEGIVPVTGDDPLADTLRVARDIRRAVWASGRLRLAEGADDLEIVQDEHFPAELGSEIATGQVTLTVPYVERLQG